MDFAIGTSERLDWIAARQRQIASEEKATIQHIKNYDEMLHDLNKGQFEPLNVLTSPPRGFYSHRCGLSEKITKLRTKLDDLGDEYHCLSLEADNIQRDLLTRTATVSQATISKRTDWIVPSKIADVDPPKTADIEIPDIDNESTIGTIQRLCFKLFSLIENGSLLPMYKDIFHLDNASKIELRLKNCCPAFLGTFSAEGKFFEFTMLIQDFKTNGENAKISREVKRLDKKIKDLMVT